MFARILDRMKIAQQQLRWIALSRLPMINAAELTKSSWARPIKSLAHVPDLYRECFATYLSENTVFPYTILAPAFERFIHKTTEKLICDTGAEIVILERTGNGFEALRFPLDSIWHVEHRTMLLDSSIKICGSTAQGTPASSTIRFNTITDYLFMPILERIRLAAIPSQRVTDGSEAEKFNYLVRTDYKFMNYAKRSLAGGEKVIHFLHQPEIRENLWTVLGRTHYRTVFPTCMIILTDRELIVIRENEARGAKSKYGGNWDYIPLNRIETLSLSETNGRLLVLSILLPGEEQIQIHFRDSLRPEIGQFLAHFRQATAASRPTSAAHTPERELLA